ncbi:MAG: energy transducer TonB [Flavobacteriaceae bacterium]|nr:energy transducer TonB [Flavobacteriaceae bacterium]|tara:strand:+ start:2276 stop:3010 length:735 start_codon:yes stop_codon:yes gene_type:complete
MEVKKNPKLSLDRWSIVFFQTGLVLMLSIAYFSLEWKSYETSSIENDALLVDDDLELDIPVIDLQIKPPPPPPPTQVIQTVITVVEDDSDIEEIIIESTETDQEYRIAEIENIVEVKEEEVIAEVPFAVIEEIPTYPGCESFNDRTAKKECMEGKIMEFIQRNFNTELASELGLEGKQRISVLFKIDIHGSTSNIKARAPHQRLEQEAVRVVSTLPKMSPGKQRGKPVEVFYSLPILFQVELRQ